MRQRTTGLLCGFSLLIAAAVLVLWVRSYSTECRDRVVVNTRGGWWTIESRRGELVMAAPPRLATTGREAKIRELAVAVRNSDFRWREYWCVPPQCEEPRLLGVSLRRATERTGSAEFAAFCLGRAASGQSVLVPESRVPLVAALDDPERFAAAHILLTLTLEGGLTVGQERRSDATRCTYEGLVVDLLDQGAVRRYHSIASLDVDHTTPASIRIDPSQMQSIRDRWRGEFEVRLLGIPYRWMALVVAITPTVWCVTAARQSLRHRRGLCPACGYDLRATAPGGACPECGRAVAAGAAAPAV